MKNRLIFFIFILAIYWILAISTSRIPVRYIHVNDNASIEGDIITITNKDTFDYINSHIILNTKKRKYFSYPHKISIKQGESQNIDLNEFIDYKINKRNKKKYYPESVELFITNEHRHFSTIYSIEY